MRKVSLLLLVVILAACGNGSVDNSNRHSILRDSSLSGSIITDTAGAREINADTSGMSEAR
ncbi:MAG: hypothetical protein ACR2KZ_12325 [Segetibacter sp.]